MKLTNLKKKDFEEILSHYDLGEYKSSKGIGGGWVNYNYTLKTDKGTFVVRVLGSKMSKENSVKLANEFKILSYLKKNKFPYAIPCPIKNREGKYLTCIFKNNLWIYPKIEGSDIKDYDKEVIRNMIKALATYHKYVKGLRIKNEKGKYSIETISKRYALMKKQKPNSEQNKVMLEEIDLFERALRNVKKINFNTPKLPIHYDAHKGNFLFNKKQVAGILDFERILYAPKILDIAHLIKCTYDSGKNKFMKKINFIIKEYEKTNSLTKKEKSLILPTLAKDNCRMFEEFYGFVGGDVSKEGDAGELACLKWTIDVQKNVMRELEW